jgi:acetyl esterase/lipase
MTNMYRWPLALVLAGAAFVAWSASSAPISYSDLLARPRPEATLTRHYGPEPDQVAELFLPKREGPIRTIVLIHGGCWLAAIPGTVLMDYLAEDLRKRGFAVWNIDYRRIGENGGGYPGTFLDVAKAMDTLRDIAPAYKLDLSRLVVIGHSAGGHLAVWAAARPHLPHDSVLYESNPLPISAVVSLAGINDLADYRDHGPSACGGPSTIDSLVGPPSGTRKDVYADTSPSRLLPIGVRQILVSGSLDPIVPARFAESYGDMARASGDKVELLTIARAGHFELIDPTSDAWKQIEPVIEALEKN